MGLLERKPGETRRSAPGPAEMRLTLDAFGKHPGWADHIDSVAGGTQNLAQLRRALYVGGITSQNDSGAWTKLDSNQLIAGFDHQILWLNGGHVVLGLMWSSTDRKDRSAYPMVVCADAEGMSADSVVSGISPELERLRSACQATTSSDQVALELRNSQNRLRSFLSSASGAQTTLSVDVRRQFINSPELGPDRVGLLRVLHELVTLLGTPADRKGPTRADLRSLQLRLPTTTSVTQDALLLWASFLSCLMPAGVPLLLLIRPGVDWLDAIVAEPTPDDFFCLQALPSALPLTTTIAYQFSPDLKTVLQGMEARFLSIDGQRASETQSTVSQQTSTSLFTSGQSASSTPSAAPEISQPAKRRRRWGLWLVILVLACFTGSWPGASGQRQGKAQLKNQYSTSNSDA